MTGRWPEGVFGALGPTAALLTTGEPRPAQYGSRLDNIGSGALGPTAALLTTGEPRPAQYGSRLDNIGSGALGPTVALMKAKPRPAQFVCVFFFFFFFFLFSFFFFFFFARRETSHPRSWPQTSVP